MKDVSGTYISLIKTNVNFIMGHLYTFTSAAGALDYMTDLDIDVSYGGNYYYSGRLAIDGLRRTLSVGLEVDEQTIKIWATPNDVLWGSNFLQGAQQGLLDGAYLKRQRIVWPIVSGNLAYDVVSQTPVAVFTLFGGYFGQILKGGQTHVEVKVRSSLAKLEVNMPRNYYQPGCLWTLFDSGCTLTKASFATSGTVDTGADYTTVPVLGGIGTPTGADGIANYAQGRLLFTSGVNENLQVLINSNDSNNLFLAYPLDLLPAEGDTFNYYPGCSKSFNTCNLKYSNTANYRGFDKVPPVLTSI